jgi:pimeloyl-ACP methyl ester carboxylesterase
LEPEPKPFLHVPEEVLDDLRRRLNRTRLPNAIEGIGWDQGTHRDYLEGLLHYWCDEYDWRVAESRLNELEHVATTIDGQRIHAIHARSPEPSALPLVITHGWPGSVVEFLDIIGPLNDPRAHGGDPADAFHVVCPSLPGYAFSGPTHERGWHPRRIAAAWAECMGSLGYERYGAQGGDWGSVVSSNLADLRPDSVVGLHLNFVTVRPPKDAPPLTSEEQAAFDRVGEWARTGAGYQEIQGTRPQTLGYGLEDSPAGLCAWIVEKFREWSDDFGSFSNDQLLTNVMVYWITRTATSSARLYWEMRQARREAIPQARVDVPTGIANFPGEITRMPRAWVEHRYNVTHWTEPERGGHFAAMEVPGLFVDDVRTFFRTVR